MVWHRTQAAIQELVDEAPKAKRYYSDAFDAYDRLWYHGGVYKSPRAKPIPIRSKAITPNCATIWHGLSAAHVVFRVPGSLEGCPRSSLCTASIDANCRSSLSQLPRSCLSNLSSPLFIHSPLALPSRETSVSCKLTDRLLAFETGGFVM